MFFTIAGNPRNKLEASGRVVVGQVAEIQADSFKDGAKKELFHIKLHLDQRRYLKPDLAFNKDNIASLIVSVWNVYIREENHLCNVFVHI